jgi:hypothetical protein
VGCRGFTYEGSLNRETFLLCTWLCVAARFRKRYMNCCGTETLCPVVWEGGGSEPVFYPVCRATSEQAQQPGKGEVRCQVCSGFGVSVLS